MEKKNREKMVENKSKRQHAPGRGLQIYRNETFSFAESLLRLLHTNLNLNFLLSLGWESVLRRYKL